MSARGDYPNLASMATARSNIPAARVQLTEALDEIDRLRAELERLKDQYDALISGAYL